MFTMPQIKYRFEFGSCSVSLNLSTAGTFLLKAVMNKLFRGQFSVVFI